MREKIFSKGRNRYSSPKNMVFFFSLFFLTLLLTPIFLFSHNVSDIVKNTPSSSVEELKKHFLNVCYKFSKANSKYLHFLSKVEEFEVDKPTFNELNTTLRDAISEMKKAKKALKGLKKPLSNKMVINALSEVDCKKLAEKYGPIPPLYERVKLFTKKGNIDGLLRKLNQDATDILSISNKIKIAIEKKQFPEVRALYKLNQKCLKSMLFRQYFGMILFEVQSGRNK